MGVGGLGFGGGRVLGGGGWGTGNVGVGCGLVSRISLGVLGVRIIA